MSPAVIAQFDVPKRLRDAGVFQPSRGHAHLPRVFRLQKRAAISHPNPRILDAMDRDEILRARSTRPVRAKDRQDATALRERFQLEDDQ
jgi:hypothetical protein